VRGSENGHGTAVATDDAKWNAGEDEETDPEQGLYESKIWSASEQSRVVTCSEEWLVVALSLSGHGSR
jgi:hypothetical protein